MDPSRRVQDRPFLALMIGLCLAGGMLASRLATSAAPPARPLADGPEGPDAAELRRAREAALDRKADLERAEAELRRVERRVARPGPTLEGEMARAEAGLSRALGRLTRPERAAAGTYLAGGQVLMGGGPIRAIDPLEPPRQTIVRMNDPERLEADLRRVAGTPGPRTLSPAEEAAFAWAMYILALDQASWSTKMNARGIVADRTLPADRDAADAARLRVERAEARRGAAPRADADGPKAP